MVIHVIVVWRIIDIDARICHGVFVTSNNMFSAILGLSAGLGHVFSGPDHLTAIAPLAMKNPRRSWIAGAQWGLGHSTGVFVVGLLSLLLRDMLPQELISSWS